MFKTRFASQTGFSSLTLLFFVTLWLGFCVIQPWFHACYASSVCIYDTEGDHDVDGSDLAAIASEKKITASQAADIAAEYGLNDCVIPSPPKLSMLVAPEKIILGTTALVQFNYADQGEDITFLNMHQSNALGNDSVSFDAKLLNITASSGTIQMELNTTELPFGETEFSMQLKDSAGAVSQQMQFTMTVVGESAEGTAPSLSDMQSLSLYQNRPEGRFDSVRPVFRFTYSDPDENINRLRVRLIPPVGEATVMETSAGDMCCQGSVGEVTQSFFDFRDTSPLGEYTVELTLFDDNGLSSNTVNALVHLVSAGGVQALSLTRFSPVEGPAGTQVLLQGKGFDSTQIENNRVEINQVPCEIVAVTDTALTLLIPEGVGTGAFFVRTGKKTAWTDTLFVVPVSITVSPSTANLVVNSTLQFDTLVVSGTSEDVPLVWSVNDIQGGEETIGTITQEGVYTAPAEIPLDGRVVIKAMSNASPSVAGQCVVTLQPPLSLPGEGRILAATGGGVISRNGLAAADIPAGALPQNTDITVEALSGPILPVSPSGKRVVGGAAFGPSGIGFTRPVTVIIPLIRYYAPGKQLSLLAYNPVTETFLDEGSFAAVDTSGSKAVASVLHFSTYVILDEAHNTPPVQPPEIIDTFPVSGREGTKVPVLVQGNFLTSDLQADVFLEGVPNTSDIIPGPIYTSGGSAGLVLDIQTLTTLDAGDTQTYTIRLKRFDSAPGEQETFFDFNVQGLNEFNLAESESLDLANPGEMIYSEVFIGGTLTITSGRIDIRSTGPVEITGIINARGKDGETADSRMGAPAGAHGGAGGRGRIDNDCLFGTFCPEAENYGRNGNDCFGFPEFEAQGFCRPLTGSGKTIPKGLGGAPGVNIGFNLLDIFGLGSCALGPVPTCISAVLAVIDAAVSGADIADGSVTGSRGFGAVLVSDQDETGGGGGGGGGRVAIGMGSYFPGGGGGAGGDGGRDVSIVTPDEIILSHCGVITTEGGNGGNGSDTTLFPMPIPGVPPVPVPALPGGGGGGGSGGYLEIASGRQIALASEQNQLRFGGGLGGSGGITIVDTENGNMRVAFKANYASNGPTIGCGRSDPVRALGSPVFDPGSIDTMVTNRTFFSIRFAAAGSVSTVIVESDSGIQNFEMTKSSTHFEGNILLEQGFNTLSISGMDDALLKKQILVLAVDSDSDGLSDADEDLLGTDPEQADTDHDGLIDSDEVVRRQTDPLEKDSDLDGLTDYQEVMNTGTDPNDPDMDKDGFKDSLEIFLSTSPLDKFDIPLTLPEGIVYAVAKNRSGAFLALLNPQTGAIGLAGQPGGIFGLGLQKNKLYAANGTTLNTLSLLSDWTGSVGDVKDPAGDPLRVRHIAGNRVENMLYGVELGPGPDYKNTGQLVQISTWNAGATRIGSPLDDPILAMVFTNEGLLFAVLEGRSASDRLVELDPATGAILNEIGNTGADDICGIAFLQTGELLAVNKVSGEKSQLLTIDLSTGAGTHLSQAEMEIFDITTPYGCISRLVDSCTDTWSCPKLISAGGYCPDMAIDKTDRLHLIHAFSETGYWGDVDTLTFRYWENGSLCGSEMIDDSPGNGEYGSISIDPDTGDLHASYGAAGLFYAKKEPGIGMWTQMMVDADGGKGTSIAIDSFKKIHIASFRQGWDLGTDQLLYATNASGNWVVTPVVNDIYSYGSLAPSLGIDAANKVHTVYYQGMNQDLMHVTNASGDWVVSTIDVHKTDTSMVGLSPELAIDSNGDLHVCYIDLDTEISDPKDRSKLKYATNQGVSPGYGNCSVGSDWNCEVVAPGTGDTSIALGVDGSVHIAYGDGESIRHAKQDTITKTWTTAPVFSSGSWQLDIDEISMAVDSLGKAHIVYLIVDYRYDFTPYEADLYYIREK